MNKIEFVKEKIPFTQVANGVLTDKRLTAKAKGLYAYLYSKPDGWDFAIDRIALEMADGRLSINNGLRELEQYGFLTRLRQSDGRVVYTVHFPPLTQMLKTDIGVEKPYDDNATVVKPQSAKTDTVSNKDSIIIKSKTNKDNAEPSSADIIVVLDMFAVMNPAVKRMYGNTTQRKACRWLIDTYGLERIKSVVLNTLPKTNGLQFFPTITTPLNLQDKWTMLESAIKRYQADKLSTKEKYKVI